MFLALNSGSSTLKFKLFSSDSEEKILEGIIKKYDNSKISFETNFGDQEFKVELDLNVWDKRLDYIFNYFTTNSVISSMNDIRLVVHRIVHGGEEYKTAVLITSEELDNIKKYSQFAPLHNPQAIEIIERLNRDYPNLRQYGVFDTSFNLTIERENFLYGLPYEYYTNYGLRRYGFHGISHKHIANWVSNKSKDHKIISCHLGSGSSICAIQNGKAVDNSFGFSPNENLIMATRSGDSDFDALIFLKKQLNLSDEDLTEILNNKSGLLGISGYSKDMRKLIEDYETNTQAKLAVDMYISKVLEYIGNYYFKLEGADYIIFTGGIGCGSNFIRSKILDKLQFLGILYLKEINDVGEDVDKPLNISHPESKTQVWVVPTDEELQMVRDVKEILKS